MRQWLRAIAVRSGCATERPPAVQYRQRVSRFRILWKAGPHLLGCNLEFFSPRFCFESLSLMVLVHSAKAQIERLRRQLQTRSARYSRLVAAAGLAGRAARAGTADRGQVDLPALAAQVKSDACNEHHCNQEADEADGRYSAGDKQADGVDDVGGHPGDRTLQKHHLEGGTGTALLAFDRRDCGDARRRVSSKPLTVTWMGSPMGARFCSLTCA